MNRINISIILSFIFIMTVSVLFYNPEAYISNNSKNECSKSGCCIKKVIACGSNCTKPCCDKT